MLIWNDRRTTTPFLADYERMLLKYASEFRPTDLCLAMEVIDAFFSPDVMKIRSYDNFQVFDFESVRGWLLSASYMPEAGHPDYLSMMDDLKTIFDAHNTNGRITLEYDTRIFYGHLF